MLGGLKQLALAWKQARAEWGQVKDLPQEVEKELTEQVSYLLRCSVCGALVEKPAPRIYFDRKIEEGEHVTDARHYRCPVCGHGILDEVVERRGPSRKEIEARVEKARAKEQTAYRRLQEAEKAFFQEIDRLLEEERETVLQFLEEHGTIKVVDGVPMQYDIGWDKHIPVDEEKLAWELKNQVMEEVVSYA